MAWARVGTAFLALLLILPVGAADDERAGNGTARAPHAQAEGGRQVAHERKRRLWSSMVTEAAGRASTRIIARACRDRCARLAAELKCLCTGVAFPCSGTWARKHPCPPRRPAALHTPCTCGRGGCAAAELTLTLSHKLSLTHTHTRLMRGGAKGWWGKGTR